MSLKRLKLTKPMAIMLILTGLLFGIIFSYKAFTSYMIKQYMRENAMPPAVVSAITVSKEPWQPKITATGNIKAINGVDITTEIEGLIKIISFTPGKNIQAGEIILELNADAEIAQLKALEAQAKLAQITYKRAKEQFAVKGISQETLDRAKADLESKNAQVAAQAAIVAKKTIRAPFKGRLGISTVNLGQYLMPGDKIVTLQAVDPIYVDFYVPQQSLPLIAVNQPVTITTDVYPKETFHGRISSINPKIDLLTRNVEVEAILSNKDSKLLSGMYGVVEIKIDAITPYLTVPQTAISYNPFGDLVYILKPKEKDQRDNTLYVAHQKFVTVGETRDDQIQILKGLEEGDLVVTAGQLKLKNGSTVIVDNKVDFLNALPLQKNE